jgi:hypothetical protein
MLQGRDVKHELAIYSGRIILTFLNVEGLSKDFSHIQQACFFSRGLGPELSFLVLRDEADLEELAHAVRMDCVISAGVAEGPGNARAGGSGRGGDE